MCICLLFPLGHKRTKEKYTEVENKTPSNLFIGFILFAKMLNLYLKIGLFFCSCCSCKVTLFIKKIKCIEGFDVRACKFTQVKDCGGKNECKNVAKCSSTICVYVHWFIWIFISKWPPLSKPTLSIHPHIHKKKKQHFKSVPLTFGSNRPFCNPAWFAFHFFLFVAG